MKVLQLDRLIGRKLKSLFDLFCPKLHQIFVDDTADVLKIDGERDHLHCAAAFAIIQALPGSFRDIELDCFVTFINRVVHPLDLGHQLAVVGH